MHRFLTEVEFNAAIGGVGFTAATSIKMAVNAATTSGLGSTYDNGAGTLTSNDPEPIPDIDGVPLSLGSRVLVKNQGSSIWNGIYSVTNVGSGIARWVMTRAVDANTADKLRGARVLVEHWFDNINGDTEFWLRNVPFVLGTDPVDWYILPRGGVHSVNGRTGDVVGLAESNTAPRRVVGTIVSPSLTTTFAHGDTGLTSRPGVYCYNSSTGDVVTASVNAATNGDVTVTLALSPGVDVQVVMIGT